MILISFLILMISGNANASAWRSASNPARFLKSWNLTQIETHLEQLPEKGAVPLNRTPWPSSYFPNQRNGFNYRAAKFQALKYDFIHSSHESDFYELFFDLKRPHSFAEARKMSTLELNQLSPFEKYSVYLGEFSYTLDQLFKQNSASAAYWLGYCDAWAAASIQYPEPAPVTVQIEGLSLEFSSSDLKALLVANLQLKMRTPEVLQQDSLLIGSRCDRSLAVPALKTIDGINAFGETTDTEDLLDQDLKAYLVRYLSQREAFGLSPLPSTWLKETLNAARLPSCEDTNAGAFHLILTNQIGLAKKSFSFDLARDVEIWNQPAYRYESKIEPMLDISSRAAPGTAKSVKVTTQLWYADDTFYGWSFHDPILTPFLKGSPMSARFKKEYSEYQQLLVKNGERKSPGTYPDDLLESITYQYVLDLDSTGQIIGGTWLTYDRPDFIWVLKNQEFESAFSKLPSLLSGI